ncbi:hypothetical protein L5B97_00260 [Avibacterium sp. 20-15]|uniref:hypothetical protein n=1 Tax=unclassified Avibacterium TaxID=2685287 RepID=UPI00202752BC|nr:MULTISPECIES: hypothetical protein [unclassified Avibacterium]MCW9731934.1 hypothetical protein [Avibacterium sp. 20-15]URL04123.1 hypothetical protein L4F93_11340 [Avibacterium sp. 20-132]
MLNLFKKPIEIETLDDWAKMSIDITKVAILAIPVILFNSEPLFLKVIKTIFLIIGAYSGLIVHRQLRQVKSQRKEEKQ